MPLLTDGNGKTTAQNTITKPFVATFRRNIAYLRNRGVNLSAGSQPFAESRLVPVDGRK
ncbi:MAG: hypothetical protein LBC20_06605 [Planctomycetaceae bacterium]|nr:hypothetical protein [Planctomycetaceae bacterium]